MNKPVLEIQARDVPHAYYDNIDEETGLLKILHIAIGFRVMLTYNTWVEGGLANASLGTVRAIIFRRCLRKQSLFMRLSTKKITLEYAAKKIFSLKCPRKKFFL